MTTPDLDAFGQAAGNGVWTSSRLVMLARVYLGGYTVRLAKQKPFESLLGRVYYRRVWLLQPPEAN